MSKNFAYTKCLGVFQGQNDLIWDVCLHKEGLILYSGSDNGRLMAWNAETCQPIGSMVCQGSVTQIEAKRMVIIAAGDRVIVTEVMPNGMFAPVKFATVPVVNPTVPPGAPGHIIGVVSMFVEDTRMFVGYADGFIRLWNQGKLAREYKVHNGVVMCIEKDGDTVFSGGQDQSVYAMDARDGKPFALYKGQHGPIRAINVYKNNLCIATGNAIRVQTIDQGELVQRLCGHTHPIFSLLRDRNLLYSGSGDRRVFVWNLDTLWPIMEIQTGHQGRVKAMSLSPKGMLYTASSDKCIRKFDMKDAFFQVEAWKKQNPNLAQPPQRSRAQNGGGTLTAGMMRQNMPEMKPLNPGVAPPLAGSKTMSMADLAAMLPELPGESSNSTPPTASDDTGTRGFSDDVLPTPPGATPIEASLAERAQSLPSSRQQQTAASPPVSTFDSQQYGNLALVNEGHGVASSGLVPTGDGGYEALRPLPAFPTEALQTPPASLDSSFGSGGGDEGHTCSVCGNVYASAGDLQIHTTKRHGTGETLGTYSTSAGDNSYVNVPIFSESSQQGSYQALPSDAASHF